MDPQHWAVWLDSCDVYAGAEASEPVDEDGIDFDTADDPKRGTRHWLPPLPVHRLLVTGKFCIRLVRNG